MKDICIDYCESTDCTTCNYKNSTKEERQKAYQEIVKEKEFSCPLHCKLPECKGKFCDRYIDYTRGYSDCRRDIFNIGRREKK